MQQNAIDFEHLRSITFSDRKLESEVLSLFGERASASLIAIEQSMTEVTRAEAAHRLVGAARAIGANELATAAEAIERAGELSPQAVKALSDTMAAVIQVLEDRMSGENDQPQAG